jgi:hypothetical protein
VLPGILSDLVGIGGGTFSIPIVPLAGRTVRNRQWDKTLLHSIFAKEKSLSKGLRPL